MIRSRGACSAAARAWLAVPTAGAHPAPNSMLRLEFRADRRARRMLDARVGTGVRARRGSACQRALAAYLLRHVAAETPDGAPLDGGGRRRARDDLRSTTLTSCAELTLVPPRGASAREPFVLVDDAVTHEVRNHVVYVVARRDAGTICSAHCSIPARRLESLP